MSKVNEIMTTDPVAVTTDTTIAEVARTMREEDIGHVLVMENDQLTGILTDRDLTVRALANARDANDTVAGEVCSSDVVTCAAQDDVDQAVRTMREQALRRMPVMHEGQLVGTVTIGDLAVRQDSTSALADISRSEPNR